MEATQTQGPVLFYSHPNWWADNYSAFTVRIWHKLFQTPEHAYHWAKFPDYPEIQDFIFDAGSPYLTKEIARIYKNKRREDWDEVKISIMEEIIWAKTAQHEYVRRKLIKTDTREIIEDSPVDGFWGRGPNGDGQNHMGKIWMRSRDRLNNILSCQA